MKLKFQDKFYDIIDHNKCPSSEKQNQKCILRKSYFHQIQPTYVVIIWNLLLKTQPAAAHSYYFQSVTLARFVSSNFDSKSRTVNDKVKVFKFAFPGKFLQTNRNVRDLLPAFDQLANLQFIFGYSLQLIFCQYCRLFF